MSQHQQEAHIDQGAETCKPRFRRKRQTVLVPVEEILKNDSWRTRTPQDKSFKGQVRFKVAGLYVAGKRVRRYFGTRAEAETFIEAQTVRQGNLGARATHIDGRLIEEAVECESMLKAHGLRLLDAVRDFLAAKAHLRAFPNVTLAEAAENYASILGDRAKSWTVDEGAEAWIQSLNQKGKSPSYMLDVHHRLKRFRESFGPRSMADVTTSDVDAWVNALGVGPQSIKNFITVVTCMFNFGLKQGRSPRNPIANVERPDVRRDDAGILTPAQLRGLLNELPDDTVPFVVLSSFSGLRPMEVRRLQWQDINFKTALITVRSGTAKTKRRRTVPMTDNLRTWLQPLAKEEGPVVEIADITIRQKRLKPARERSGLKLWPHDCLRHSAATYWLQIEGNAALVALWLGHSQEVLHRHYRGLLSDPADAAEWFAIVPPPKQGMENIIDIKTA